MRVLYVINDLGGGGAQRVAITAVAGLIARGHEVAIVTLTDRRAYTGSVPIFSLRQRRSGGSLGVAFSGWRLRRWLRGRWGRSPPDLVISALPWADQVVQAAHLPNTWHWIHNTLSEHVERDQQLASVGGQRKLKRLRRRYDGRNLISVSHGVADDLRDKIGCDSARITTIYNPFDLEAIKQLAREAIASIPNEPFVLHVGRFAPQKRHDILFEAYKASGISHRLVLLTSPRPDLAALIAKHGLDDRVTVAGFQDNPYPWYAGAAALVLSSDFEGFGNVIVEALASGTPVISTDCPWGPAEIMTGPLERYLAPVGDSNRLAELIRQVTDERPSIDPATVDRFSVTSHIRAIEALASGQDLLSQRNP